MPTLTRQTMTKHYVRFTYAGSFVSEHGDEPIRSRDSKIILPRGAYAWRVFDREEVRHGGEVLKGEPKNFGPRHIVGEVFDVERVRREVPDNDILLSNMKCNRWPKVIRCRQGFIPMEKDDVVIEPATAQP